MSKLALFPLNLVVYPKEKLNLHIFEPRYKQLIKDCIEEGITFGITAFIDNKIKTFGTEVKLLEVVNRYEDGRLDIRTEGTRVFQVNEFFNPMPGKLYAGADVDFVDGKEDSILTERILLVELVTRLFDLLEINTYIPIESEYITYMVAHKVGFTLKQEYELLTLLNESDRIKFMLDHLNKIIPIVQETELTKQRVRMNGHFKHLNPLKF
ncbi:MAG: LON peptidase substrate-binding domain-containing protein [Flammeovirgaceae bacterium]